MNVTFRSRHHTTLARVASLFGIAVADILAANPNRQYSIIRGIGPGEEIYVPFYSTRTGFSFGSEPRTSIGETSTIKPSEEWRYLSKSDFENFFSNFGTFAVCLIAYRYKG